jgi:hypothetical protein
MERLGLRVKHLESGCRAPFLRDGKGARDRGGVLHDSLCRYSSNTFISETTQCPQDGQSRPIEELRKWPPPGRKVAAPLP